MHSDLNWIRGKTSVFVSTIIIRYQVPLLSLKGLLGIHQSFALFALLNLLCQAWRLLFRFFAPNAISVVLIGLNWSSNWQPRALIQTPSTPVRGKKMWHQRWVQTEPWRQTQWTSVAAGSPFMSTQGRRSASLNRFLLAGWCETKAIWWYLHLTKRASVPALWRRCTRKNPRRHLPSYWIRHTCRR